MENLAGQKEKLMQEAKEIVNTRADELSAQHDLDDLEGTLIGLVTLLKVKVKQLPKMRKLQKFGNLL